MSRTATRDKKADKRRHILEAAVEVFARAGFHKSRVADIAREADVADGTIYLYFKGKDDVLISIFEETMTEMIEAAEAALEGIDDPLDRLHVEGDTSVAFIREAWRRGHAVDTCEVGDLGQRDGAPFVRATATSAGADVGGI